MNITDFLGMAQSCAAMSKDPSTKVGALVLGSGFEIVSQGWNGFPRGVGHHQGRYLDKATKYKFTVHAEANAIANAARAGTSTCGCSMLIVGLPPCENCAGLIIQSGIKQVYLPKSLGESIWTDSYIISKVMFEESKVSIKEY